jgi:hypothetical protein
MCLPAGPHSRSAFSPNMAAITCSPVPTARASRPSFADSGQRSILKLAVFIASSRSARVPLWRSVGEPNRAEPIHALPQTASGTGCF